MPGVTRNLTWMTHKWGAVVDCEIHWDSGDPFAVSLTFIFPDRDPVEWKFAMDLLTDITEERANVSGLCDVKTERIKSTTGDQFVLYLTSPFGEQKLVTLVSVIKEFTDSVKDLLPPDESMEIVTDMMIRQAIDDWCV